MLSVRDVLQSLLIFARSAQVCCSHDDLGVQKGLLDSSGEEFFCSILIIGIFANVFLFVDTTWE